MIYLDNSATTPVDSEVFKCMRPYLEAEYGNPSSKYYALAENARKAVEEARRQVARLVGCDPDEVIFTSGATESNNMVIKGVADYYGKEGDYIITSQVEHPSVLESCRYLESKGFNIIYLDVDHFGRIDHHDLEEKIKQYRPILVSIIWGNNEIGSLNPIEKIAALCARYNIFFHSDATQVIGKLRVDLARLPGLRFLSLSGHKIFGPKGIGACIIRKESATIKTRITPLLHGGGQEDNYRSGTLAVHNIVGLGKAAELAYERLDSHIAKLNQLEAYLKDILITHLGDKIAFHNDWTEKIPGLLSVRFKGVNNELLIKKVAPVMALSTGSACSSSKPSHVLQAIGKSMEEIRETVRISLSPYLKMEDLDIFKRIR